MYKYIECRNEIVELFMAQFAIVVFSLLTLYIYVYVTWQSSSAPGVTMGDVMEEMMRESQSV